MIPPDVFPSYAQYHEDIILAALFKGKKDGFYVDVGANYEEYHSVTKYFYERGWRGINIEPIPRLIKTFNKKRPRDINLNYAVAAKKGTLSFREYPNHDGYSTFSEETKKENEKLGLPHIDYDVKVDSLKNIFTRYKLTEIDFLKIDVEGFENEVLHSNDWKIFRPKVICIEANHRDEDWSKFIISQKYTCIIFDGLNEYYIDNESMVIFDNFAERATILAHNGIRNHLLNQWREDINHIVELTNMIEQKDKTIRTLQHTQQTLDMNMQNIKFLLKQLKKQIILRLRVK
ncbi:FkbM family methyltransferase [Candidatus Saccharibacteria bacterium]|nr:FkbM family methyltransferase [Candidatus Saccharibacteria bacterium]